jgi:hypothetical protein
MKCTQGYKAEVLQSTVGFYIGTIDDDGPNCRLTEYYNSYEEAEEALSERTFTIRDASELRYCNKKTGCFIIS